MEGIVMLVYARKRGGKTTFLIRNHNHGGIVISPQTLVASIEILMSYKVQEN